VVSGGACDTVANRHFGHAHLLYLQDSRLLLRCSTWSIPPRILPLVNECIELVLIKHLIPTLAAPNPPASSLPTAGAFFVEYNAVLVLLSPLDLSKKRSRAPHVSSRTYRYSSVSNEWGCAFHKVKEALPINPVKHRLRAAKCIESCNGRIPLDQMLSESGVFLTVRCIPIRA
jgi:hypothetical protein